MKTKLILLLALALNFSPLALADDLLVSPAVAPVAEVAPVTEAVPAQLSPAAEAVKADPAKVVVAEAVPVDPNLTFLQLLIKSVGEMKGATALAIAAIVIQLLIKLMDLPIFGKFFSQSSGALKLTIVSGLTLLLAPITLMQTAGVELGAALVHSTTLAALMVFVNQIYLQFFKAKSA